MRKYNALVRVIIVPLIAGVATVVPFYIVQWFLAEIGLPPFSFIVANTSVQGVVGWIALLWLVGLVQYYAWPPIIASTRQHISLLE